MTKHIPSDKRNSIRGKISGGEVNFICGANSFYKIVLIFLGITLVILSPCFAPKIKIEKKGDVTIIHNPKKPAKMPGAPRNLSLEEDLGRAQVLLDDSIKSRNSVRIYTQSAIQSSEMSWKTLEGEERNYEKTCDRLTQIMEEYKILGISFALTQKSPRKQAKTLFFYLGIEDPSTGKPIDGETVFRAGRLGQPVFAYMVMKLFTGRRFDIDIPIHKYLPKPIPEYPAYRDLKGDSRYKRLTASRILSHQSGLVNSRMTHPEHRLTFEADPGKGFRYSEEGYRLLQFVLEQRFGRSLNDLAKIVAFDRLSMKNSSFLFEPRFEGHLAKPIKTEDFPENNASDTSKTFFTTAKEYNNFMWTVLYNGGTLDLGICAPYFRPEISVHSPTILEPPLPGEHPTIPEKLSWCLGWGTYKIPQDMAYFIGDRFQGIECFAIMSPTHGIAVTIFVVGNDQHSVTSLILKEIIGDIETPLTWLGFE
jgi:CubicO group peptidase (beta-lactamase class C family)